MTLVYSNQHLPLILASTSPYRKILMEKTGLIFSCQPPTCNEDSIKKQIQDPKVLAETLARLKAESLQTPSACVVGGDQVAALRGEILGKPGTMENAFLQLKKLQGQTHQLFTAVCVICQEKVYPILNITTLKMRPLTDMQIQAYIAVDKPLDCAGSYKIEKTGITLFENIETKDFSAIEGLPLIELTNVLIRCGFLVPKAKHSTD